MSSSSRDRSRALAIRAINGGRLGKQIREGLRRDGGRAAAGVTWMVLGGEADEVGHLEIPGQEEKAVHKVIFMRHGESEWNRYYAVAVAFATPHSNAFELCRSNESLVWLSFDIPPPTNRHAT